MKNIFIKNEAEKQFNDWVKERLEFLLQHEQFHSIAIIVLSQLLEIHKNVEFTYKGFFYEIFESADNSYVINVYSSNEYTEDNLMDGGLCTGSAKNAIEFML